MVGRDRSVSGPRGSGALTCLFSACLLSSASFGAETIDEHLAAGEFGRAIDLANVAPAETRNELLGEIAALQNQVGDRVAAQSTARRLPPGQKRDESLHSLGGGGVVADFEYLITIIQDNTSGQWEEVDGAGGTMSRDPYGVKVRPLDVLSRISMQDSTGRLQTLEQSVRKADLNADLAASAPLRIVSLTRLEKAIANCLANGQAVPESMQRLAGLTRVQYVFAMPETGEILVAGPAEGWQYNKMGDPVGVESGRPVLQLDDLVTVLRTFARGEADFGCSINTRDEGVKALQDFAQQSQSRGAISAPAVRGWVQKLAQKLGPQDVVVWGVPADSRVARVIVEADYRMKLIGIDKLEAGRDVASYFDLLAQSPDKSAPPMEALRWWLTMKYDAVLHNEQKTVFEFQGDSVQCLSENQLLTSEGKHEKTGVSEGTNRQFAEQFTQHYAKLAAKEPVFADAQNVFDLALIGALLQREKLADRTNWDMGVFAENGAYHPAKHSVPTEVATVANHRTYRGRDIVVQVAGGVRADVTAALSQATPEAKIETVATQAPANLPAGRWWWDTAK